MKYLHKCIFVDEFGKWRKRVKNYILFTFSFFQLLEHQTHESIREQIGVWSRSKKSCCLIKLHPVRIIMKQRECVHVVGKKKVRHQKMRYVGTQSEPYRCLQLKEMMIDNSKVGFCSSTKTLKKVYRKFCKVKFFLLYFKLHWETLITDILPEKVKN